MIYRAGNRFNEENYFLTEIDTSVPDCEVTGFLDGVPVSFFGECEAGMIEGGSVVWNQKQQILLRNGSTMVKEDQLYIVNHDGNSRTFFGVSVESNTDFKPIENHKYLWSVDVKNINVSNLDVVSFANGFKEPVTVIGFTNSGRHTGISTGKGNTYLYFNCYLASPSTSTEDSFTFENLFIIDLTEMFGTEIADNIYSLEQITTGAGVTLFTTLFAPDDYYNYNAGENMRITLRKTE